MLPVPQKEISFYIGIPFCKKPCKFCHYRPNIRFGVKTIPEAYINTLLKQIQDSIVNFKLENKKLLSCYFGGGTPSLLSKHQLSCIINLFSKYNITFEERSIEIHPAILDKSIIDLKFFNRFSIGVQSTQSSVLDEWNRDVYSQNEIKDLYTLLRKNNRDSIINFDFLFYNKIYDSDLAFINELSPDTVVFYPQTGPRNELIAAQTLASLKRAELSLCETRYFRQNENSFHFYRNYKSISKYSRGEYSFTSDILGVGHNSVSRIGSQSFLSLYDDQYNSWEYIHRKRDTEFELLWGSLLYGIPVQLEPKLPKEISRLLHNDKHFETKYIPLEKNVWEKFFDCISTLPDDKQSFCWKSFFWSDDRKKDLQLFFKNLDDSYQALFSRTTSALSPKSIPQANVLIEGIDGSGKDTFAFFLVEYLHALFFQQDGRSISLIGLPSSKAIYGTQCKCFIENADKSFPYDDIKSFLSQNREDFCAYINTVYPGLHIFVRSILTEQGTLSCLYPNHIVSINNCGVSKIDLCIIINADPILARRRIEKRGKKETWRESLHYLDYFNHFYLNHSDAFPETMIVNNLSDSIIELQSQALKIATHIYKAF